MKTPRTDALGALNDALMKLLRKAGNPTYRSIGNALPGTAHTTVADCFGGRVVPRWNKLEEIVIYLGGDPEEFRVLWRRAMNARSDATKKSLAESLWRLMCDRCIFADQQPDEALTIHNGSALCAQCVQEVKAEERLAASR